MIPAGYQCWKSLTFFKSLEPSVPDLLAMYLRFVLQMNNSNCLPISGDVVKSMKFHETMENNGFGCSDANSFIT